MGRRLSKEEHIAVLYWAQNFKCCPRILNRTLSARNIADLFDQDLRKYWNLCALSRNRKVDSMLVKEAYKLLFTTRVGIEKQIAKTIHGRLKLQPSEVKYLAVGTVFGRSLKQGLSMRFPLYSCQPTVSCSGSCYAHDGLDASIASVVRGVFNGTLAELFESGNKEYQDKIIGLIKPHCNSAIRAAFREVDNLPDKWKRAPRIRFAHVGEAGTFPKFSSKIAEYFKKESGGKIVCAVYTRHRRASDLSPTLFVVNFTLDRDSLEERKGWVPSWARTVFSAFDGGVSSDVDVNFIEHHQNGYYAKPTGEGKICPATLPQATEHFCDSCRCDLCFTMPETRK